jgi:hypothetical protein
MAGRELSRRDAPVKGLDPLSDRKRTWKRESVSVCAPGNPRRRIHPFGLISGEIDSKAGVVDPFKMPTERRPLGPSVRHQP